MEQELKEISPLSPTLNKGKQDPGTLKTTPLNIYKISTPAFALNLRQKDNTLFAITIYKIDKYIEEQNNLDLKELDKELVERTLLD
jgi:hypothetical protein